MKVFCVILFVIVLLGAFGAGLGFIYVEGEAKKLEHLTTDTTMLYQVKPGTQVRNVLEDVYHAKINKYVLRYWLHKNPSLAALKIGTYEIPADSSLRQTFAIIISGKEKSYSITLVEGGRLSDFLRVMRSNKDLQHKIPDNATYEDIAKLLNLQDPSYPEGLLLPDTYIFRYGDDDISILKRAYQANVKFLNEQYAKRASNLPYKNAYEALIMASIIEKESAVADERPLIASVFINRLRQGMKLQTDPTVIYGVRDRYNGTIFKSFLEDKNPYNTYVIDGLPITPIAMPSKEAILAALHPADSKYLFFVAKGPDSRQGHVFSENVQQHDAAVTLYRKSVRDYKKQQEQKQLEQKKLAKLQEQKQSEAKQSEATVSAQEQKQPEATVPAQEQKQPEATVPSQELKQPEATVPSQEQKRPDATVPTPEQKQPATQNTVSATK